MLTLLHSPAHIIARLLAQLGLGSTPTIGVVGAWPIYIEDLMTTPDAQIRVSNSNSLNLGRIQLTGEMVTHQGIQILVRDRRADTAYIKTQLIAETLTRNVHKATVVIDSTTYYVESIRTTGDVLPFFQRDRGAGPLKPYDHCYYSVNCLVVLTENP